jgi:predicted RNA-binding Zn ribbon-like protein
MRLSEHYAVPHGAGLLYDFVNTLDERHYVADGARLEGSDALATPALMADWLGRHGMNERADAGSWQDAVTLRSALRSYLELPPRERVAAASAFNAAASVYPLKVATDGEGRVTLVPRAGTDTLGMVLVQLHALAAAEQLDRLKACADPDCRWIFLDRSKPGSRRWCSSTGCGNRQKTRAYRARHSGGSPVAVAGKV